ncbi:MAG: cupin domain-containing protein [Xanthomonadales bacterium]|nr:cupin domain-containing protein [Xanthomonadales bacterium]
MKHQSKQFLFGEEETVEDVGGGIKRQILGYEDSLMLARASFDEGSVGYTHAHPHAQLAYVESGAFEFTIGDETMTLKQGDCAYIPSGVEHGAVCREAGVLLDIFSPMREDFLTENK